MSSNLTALKEWSALITHKGRLEKLHLRRLFAENPGRFDAFSLSLPGLLFDFSKQRIDTGAFNALIALAEARGVEEWRGKLFSGLPINATEGRSVLHTALRGSGDPGKKVRESVEESLHRLEAFTRAVHAGEIHSSSGQKFGHIVNIGIGGSDLGPRMVCAALQGDRVRDIRSHFVSNIDADDLNAALEEVDPHTTLFIIASKTFTTLETMTNAHSARAWLAAKLGSEEKAGLHFAALTTNFPAAREFGIPQDRVFPFEDWVGGRFSLWSSIGLSIALSIGFDNFRALLDGAHAMDAHFLTAPLPQNMPVILALLGVWNRNFWNAGSLVILPYSQRLSLLADYLQQLEMESNGKRVTREGAAITDYETCPVLFGQPGTNGQHAFYQMIHQGTSVIPCDFIGVVQPDHDVQHHHTLLLNNLLAQSQALMIGRTGEEASGNPHRTFPGAIPHSVLLLDRLSPYHLGMLLALYEHKVFVQGVLWGINSFDQFGVELGKELANKLEQPGKAALDCSTQGLLDYIKAHSKS